MLTLHFGLNVSDPSVWKSMRRLHFSGFSRKTRYSFKMPGLEHVLHPYLLNRDFSAPAPLQKIVTDVTYTTNKEYHSPPSSSTATRARSTHP